MQKQLEQVAEFMTLFGQSIGDKPGFGDAKVNQLRVDLLAEEVKELQEAVDAGDLRGVLDALTDIDYVLKGAVLHFGMQAIAEKSFDAVHFSNMLKASSTEQKALETELKYGEQGIETYTEKREGKFLTKRKADGKVLKSVEWVEQDLESILNKIK